MKHGQSAAIAQANDLQGGATASSSASKAGVVHARRRFSAVSPPAFAASLVDNELVECEALRQDEVFFDVHELIGGAGSQRHTLLAALVQEFLHAVALRDLNGIPVPLEAVAAARVVVGVSHFDHLRLCELDLLAVLICEHLSPLRVRLVTLLVRQEAAVD